MCCLLLTKQSLFYSFLKKSVPHLLPQVAIAWKIILTFLLPGALKKPCFELWQYVLELFYSLQLPLASCLWHMPLFCHLPYHFPTLILLISPLPLVHGEWGPALGSCPDPPMWRTAEGRAPKQIVYRAVGPVRPMITHFRRTPVANSSVQRENSPCGIGQVKAWT